jgi:hypothetical protein
MEVLMQSSTPWGTSPLVTLLPILFQLEILERANRSFFQTHLQKEDPLTKEESNEEAVADRTGPAHLGLS